MFLSVSKIKNLIRPTKLAIPVIVTFLFCYYLTLLSSRFTSTIYQKSGNSAFESMLSRFDVNPTLVNFAVAVSISTIVGLILTYCLGYYWGFFGLILFLSSAQFVLVFTSAAVWDVFNQTLPMVAFFIGLLILRLRMSQSMEPLANSFRNPWLGIFLIFMTLISVLFCLILKAVYPPKLAVIGTLLFIYCLVSFRKPLLQRDPFQKTSLTDEKKDDNLVLSSLSISLCITFLLQLSLGRPSSSVSGFIMGASCTSILLSTAKVSRNVKVINFAFVFLIWTLCFYFLKGGGSFLFYTLSGWQNSPQLWSGISGRTTALTSSFDDSFLDLSTRILQTADTGWILATFLLFYDIHWNYLLNALTISFQYIWKINETPWGLEDNFFWFLRRLLTTFIGYFSILASILTISIVFLRERRTFIYILLTSSLCCLSLALSRPQMHQWWILPLIGIWTVLATCRFFMRSSSEVSLQMSALRGLVREKYPKEKSRRWHILVLLSSFVVIFFAISHPTVRQMFADKTITSPFKPSTERRLFLALQELNWSPSKVVQPKSLTMSEILIDSNDTLLKISSSSGCDLSGLQLILERNSLSKSRRYGPQTLNRNIFIGQTDANSITIDLRVPSEISQKAFIGTPLLQRNCKFLADTSEEVSANPVPLVFLYSSDGVKSSQEISYTRITKVYQSGSRYLFAKSLNFRGYYNTGIYKAVGDDFLHNRPTMQIGQQVLGTSFQGYMSIDLWTKGIPKELEFVPRSVAYDLTIRRGTFVIGVSEQTTKKIKRSSYATAGAALETKNRREKGCFNIPPTEKHTLFLSSIVDIYSPQFIDLTVHSIRLGKKYCQVTQKNILPSL